MVKQYCAQLLSWCVCALDCSVDVFVHWVAQLFVQLKVADAPMPVGSGSRATTAAQGPGQRVTAAGVQTQPSVSPTLCLCVCVSLCLTVCTSVPLGAVD